MDNTRWLDQLLLKLGWTPADLARASKLDSAVISNIRNGKRYVGIDTAIAIAKAVKLKPETILRMAGRFPAVPETDEEIEQILHEVANLPKQDQEEVLAFIRMKNNLRKKKK